MSVNITEDLKRDIDAEVRRVLPSVTAFRHERHRRPELSWQEHATATAVAKALREIDGLKVQEGVGRLGVVALLEGAAPGPTIGLRADMDALPVREAAAGPMRPPPRASCTPVATMVTWRTSTAPLSSSASCAGIYGDA